MIETQEAIRQARGLLGTPYGQMDCIGLMIRIIRRAEGGRASYRVAGTNSLWKSYTMSPKYRDLTWRQEGIAGAGAGMLAFKRRGTDVCHVGLVTDSGTVIHSSSAKGKVVETPLDETWALLAIHRDIEAQTKADTPGEQQKTEQEEPQDGMQPVIIDDEGNCFRPMGGWRVCFGSAD